MITIVYNNVLRSIDIMLDAKGADLLIQKLQNLKAADQGHAHVYATDDDTGLATWSPYGHEEVYGELVLDILSSEAWKDRTK